MNELSLTDIDLGPSRGDLPLAERERVSLLEMSCERIERTPYNDIVRMFEVCGGEVGCSPATMKRKYYAWRNAGKRWEVLANQSMLYRKAFRAGIKHPGFQAFFCELVAASQRKTRPAVRKLYRIWDNRSEQIPGYENFPGWPNRPAGWSEKNLNRILRERRLEIQVVREGTFAIQPLMDQVLTTRVGSQAGQYYVFDDNKIDALVACGNQVVTPLQLVCQDVATGKIVSWGMMPRLKRKNPKPGEGKHMGLNERYMRMFVAGVLANIGFNEDTGVTFIVEHGTAAIRGPFEEVLTRLYKGKVKIRRSGMVQKEQVIFHGTGKGNFKFKAGLESTFNLTANEWSQHLPSPTGHDRTEPEWLAGLRDTELKLLKDQEALEITDPVRAAALLHFMPTFQQVAQDIAWRVYDLINSRTDHELEGYEKMGLVTVEVRLSEELPWQDISKLDKEDAAYLLARSGRDPHTLQKVRRLSPAEAWDRMTAVQAPLRKATQAEVIEMLFADCSRPAKVMGSYIHVKRKEMGAEVLHYPSTIVDMKGHEVRLYHGQKVYVMDNVFDSGSLYIADKDGRVLGKSTLQQRVALHDEAAIRKALGTKKKRNAQAMQESKVIQAKRTEDILRTKIYNHAVLNGAPLSLEDHVDVQAEVNERTLSPSQKAAITRRRNAANEEEMNLLVDRDPVAVGAPADDGGEDDADMTLLL